MTRAGLQEGDHGGAADTASGASVPPETSTQYTCEQCGKLFKSRVKLRNHARTHPVDFTQLQNSLGFLSKSELPSTVETTPAHQDEMFESRTAEATNNEQELKLVHPSPPAGSKTAVKTQAIRKSARRRSGIPLPTCSNRLPAQKDRSRRMSLQGIALENSYCQRLRATGAASPLLPSNRLPAQKDMSRRMSLQSTAMENCQRLRVPSVASPLATRKSDTLRPSQPNSTTRRSLVPSTNRQSVSSTPAVPKASVTASPRRSCVAKTTSVAGTGNNKRLVPGFAKDIPTTPRRMSSSSTKETQSQNIGLSSSSTFTTRKLPGVYTSTPIKTLTPRFSRTPTTPKTKTRNTSGTPITSGGSHTPRSGKKTPNTNRHTSTPRSGKKTPKSKANTPRSGKKTPNNKARTPRSGKKTPKSNTPGGERPTTPSGLLNHACNRCGKRFVSQRMLDLHYVIHVRDSPKACGIPNGVFKKRPKRLHVVKKTSVDESTPVETKMYACAKCSRVYQSESFLQAHMKTHLINEPHACDVCHKRFKFLTSLKSHKITHIGEKSHRDALKSIEKGEKTGNRRSSKAYEEECDSLNLIGSVRNSFSVSAGNDSVLADLHDCAFVCTSCDYKTSDPVELLRHMKRHSARRPHTCKECNRSYASRANLEVHGKVHVIEKLRHVLTSRGNANN